MDSAVEDAAGLVVEDTLVDLIAVAVRVSVLNAGVVVDELPSATEVQAVECALDVFAVQLCVDCVARDRTAARERVRFETAVAGRMHVHRRNVICRLALKLHLCMVECGILSQHDFGHRIGEVAGVAGAEVILGDGEIAVAANDNECARLRHCIGCRTG